ncbi:MAG: septum formation initiator family protein [Acidobacteriota bacterium]
MQANLSQTSPVRVLVVGALVVVVSLLAVAGFESYRDLSTVRDREAELRQQLENTQHSIEQLEGRIERLRTDPATLERLAREELGMLRPDEVVILLPRDEGTSATP